MNTEGYRLSELDDLELPVRAGDIVEVIQPVENRPGRFKNAHAPATLDGLPVATTEVTGALLLASDAAAAEGVQTYTAVTPTGLLLAVKNLLENKIAQGSGGIDLSYDPDQGTLTISKGGEREGRLLLIGTYDSAGLVDAVSGGDIKGAAVVYDVLSDTIDGVYQRYRVYDTGTSTELTNFTLNAISGDFAICADSSGPGGEYVAVTPYHKDADLKIGAAWAATSTLNVGSTVSLIPVGSGYLVAGVFLVGEGTFFIVSSFQDFGLRVRRLRYVTFTSETAHTIHDVTLDLDALGIDPDFDFITNSPDSFSKTVSGDVGFSVKLQHSFMYHQASIAGSLSLPSGAISNVSFVEAPGFGNISFISPLTKVPLNGNSFEDSDDSFSGGTIERSYWNTRLVFDYTLDLNIQKTTFASRSFSVAPFIVTQYDGETSPVPIDVLTAVDAHLVAAGFTLESGAIDPIKYGAYVEPL